MAKKPQGFAYLKKYHPDRLREMSSEGGKAAQAQGRGYRWSPAEARKQGAIGGQTRWRHHKKGE